VPIEIAVVRFDKIFLKLDQLQKSRRVPVFFPEGMMMLDGEKNANPLWRELLMSSKKYANSETLKQTLSHFLTY
jgi:hypothetical protein